MASFANRSRFYVTVKRRPELKREFPFTSADAARAYLAEQRQVYGPDAELRQYEDTIAVRVRTGGYKPLVFTETSYEAAERSAAKIEEERSRSLFIDYTRSMNVTPAELIKRYLREESPKHKGCEVETYTLNAMLVDSGATRVTFQEQHGPNPTLRQRKSTGQQVRDTISNLEWLHRPFALVQPTDIEEFIRDRLEHVAKATVDREIDLLSAVFNVAIKTWRYNVAQSPLMGVRRPRYFNERDRRLVGDEEARLLAAAREEDRLRSVKLRLDVLMSDARAEAAVASSLSTGKRHLAAARDRLTAAAEATAVHVPLLETLVMFLLMTAARRGEALALQWEHVSSDDESAFFPETKNGRPRKVPLRTELLDALATLPRDDARVFPLSAEQLRTIWANICARAGIVDFHFHDCRHEALSRLAETGKFSLIDLQAVSGHRDLRMLMRYAHLCVKKLAQRMNEAFAAPDVMNHKGRKRLGKADFTLVVNTLAVPTESSAAPSPCQPANVIPFPRRA